MRRHQYLGILLLVIGGVMALWPLLNPSTQKVKPTPTPSARGTTTAAAEEDISPSSQVPITPEEPHKSNSGSPPTTQNTHLTYLDYLTDRALRESEAAAQRAAMSFMKEMLAPIEANDQSFAEQLYSLGANARAVVKNESEYRDYVSTRFYAELTRNNNIQQNLDALVFEFLTRLNRIATQVALESGMDVAIVPTVTLTFKDFDGLLRAEIRNAIEPLSSTMRSQARQGAAVQGISFGIGILMPTIFLVDLSIGLGIDTAVQTFRDPEGQVAVDAHGAAEELANRICFGTDERPGLYAALLDIAHYQNRQLRDTLLHSEPITEAGTLDPVFGDHHD